MRYEKVPLVNYDSYKTSVSIIDLDLDKVIYYRPYDDIDFNTQPLKTLVLVGEKTIALDMLYSEFDKLINGL